MPDLGLGTAQFGGHYGIASRCGSLEMQQARQILEAAAEHDFCILDTAALYDESEQILGDLLWEDAPFRIVTKTVKITAGSGDASPVRRLRKGFWRSLDRLGCSSVYGLLVHDPDDLLVDHGGALWGEMRSLQEAGRVLSIGFSVYHPRTLRCLLSSYSPDLVQIPVNVFDQRFLRCGLIKELSRQGVEIHARSIFLQGLVLLPPDRLDPYFAPIKDHLRYYRETIEALELDPVSGALQFGRALTSVDTIVVGVDNAEQLSENVNKYSTNPPEFDWSVFALEDERWIDPSRWQLSG